MISFFRYRTNCGVATSAFQRAYAASVTQLPFWKWTTDDVATRQLPVRFVDFRISFPDAGLAGMSQSPGGELREVRGVREVLDELHRLALVVALL